MADARLEGLLTDIARDPEDLSLYPILADFLEDQGEFHRAHLIRIHLEQVNLPADDPRLPILEDEEYELLTEHIAGWVDGRPPGVEVDWWLGRLSVGGRPDHWKGPGRDWLLRQGPWLAGFSLWGGAEEVLADLIPAGCLRLVNLLELSDRRGTEGSLPHLVHLPHLRELRLWGLNPSEAVVAHLGRLTQLRELHFWSVASSRMRTREPRVPDEVVEELNRLLPLCRVERIVSRNER